MSRHPQPHPRQRGVTLIEGLLALAISIVMLSALIYLLAESQQELRAKNEADRMLSFQRVASQYYMANRSSLLDAMDGDDDGEAALLCRINVPANGEGGTPAYDRAMRTCMIDASLLRARRLLPEGFREATAHNERLVAVFRRVLDGDGAATENVEMVVLSVLPDGTDYVADERRHLENLSVASNMGATGGVLPDRDRGHCKAERSTNTYEICGNGWRLDLANFLDAGQLQQFAALLPR